VGWQVAERGGNPDDPAEALAATDFPDSLLTDPVLRSESTGALASRVSVHPGVRAALLARQRAFAAQPGGAVLDGRDIATVIAPHADAKLYVTASVAVGRLEVDVPANVVVDVSAHSSLGTVIYEPAGPTSFFKTTAPVTVFGVVQQPRLVLDAQVGMGEVVLVREGS